MIDLQFPDTELLKKFLNSDEEYNKDDLICFIIDNYENSLSISWWLFITHTIINDKRNYSGNAAVTKVCTAKQLPQECLNLLLSQKSDRLDHCLAQRQDLLPVQLDTLLKRPWLQEAIFAYQNLTWDQIITALSKDKLYYCNKIVALAANPNLAQDVLDKTVDLVLKTSASSYQMSRTVCALLENKKINIATKVQLATFLQNSPDLPYAANNMAKYPQEVIEVFLRSKSYKVRSQALHSVSPQFSIGKLCSLYRLETAPSIKKFIREKITASLEYNEYQKQWSFIKLSSSVAANNKMFKLFIKNNLPDHNTSLSIG